MKRLLHIDLLSFALGFVVGCLMGDTGAGIAFAATGLAACAVHRWRYEPRPATVIAAGLFAASIIASLLAPGPAESSFARYVGDRRTDVLLRLRVVDGPRHAQTFASYDAELQRVDRRVSERERIALWVGTSAAGDESETLARPGDEVEVFARCSTFAPREFPGVRSTRERRNAKGVAAGCSALEPMTILRQSTGLRARLTDRRLALEGRLRDLLGRRAGVPIAMLTGTRGFVRDSEWLAHRRAGTAHLLAISGLHFGSLATIVWLLVGLILRRVRWLARRVGTRRATAPIVLVVMAAYLFAVGAPISAVRAFIAVATVVLAIVTIRRASGLSAVSLAAVALLATSPALIFDLGFQLSFAATTVIVLFWHRLPPSLDSDPYEFEYSRWRTRLRRLGAYVLMSWLATLATWPLLLGASGQLSVVALVANPIVVPWVGFVVFPLLLSGGLLLEVAPTIGQPLVVTATELMLRTTIAVESLSEPSAAVWTPGTPASLGVLVALCSVVVVAASRFRARLVVGALIVMVSSILLALPRRPPGWRVHFLPVGQGDATLVEFPAGQRVLFDAGGSRWGRDPGRRVVVPYLWRIGVTDLDAIVVTHADTDHSGGVPAVLELLDVDRVVTEPSVLGIDGLRLERWADRGTKNDRSIVARVAASRAAILLTGDVERSAERAKLATGLARATVLKVPHHGSKTSSTEEFVDAVDPELAVVSAGRHNRFGHPHPWVVQRYHERAVPVLSTARNGLVWIDVSCNGELTVSSVRNGTESQ